MNTLANIISDIEVDLSYVENIKGILNTKLDISKLNYNYVPYTNNIINIIFFVEEKFIHYI